MVPSSVRNASIAASSASGAGTVATVVEVVSPGNAVLPGRAVSAGRSDGSPVPGPTGRSGAAVLDVRALSAAAEKRSSSESPQAAGVPITKAPRTTRAVVRRCDLILIPAVCPNRSASDATGIEPVPTLAPMPEASTPTVGLAVVHLFFRTAPLADRAGIVAALDAAAERGDQAVVVALLGHKADLGVMALSSDQWNLRRLQTDLVAAGLDLVDSYVSLTESSEYAEGIPEEMKQARLYPQLPPEGKPVFCFYPMSKRREVGANWFQLDFDRRKELMYEHGASGRKFRGRVLQVVTGSTGTDDFEWGVTLFCVNPDDVKDVVYTMRYDEASAVYGEFGPFYVGMVADPGTVLGELGID